MLPGWGQTGQSLAARQRRPGRRAAIFLMGTDGPGRCERVRGGSPGSEVLRMVGCRQAVPCTRFPFSRAAQILRRAGEMDSPFESPVLCSPSFRTVFAIC